MEPGTDAHLFRSIIETTPQALLLVNGDGIITLVNRGSERLFGYDRAELLGRELELLIPDRFRSQHRGHAQAFLEAPSARKMGVGRDLYGRRKDGSEVAIEIGLTPIDGPTGVSTLASIIDITERKRQEEELRAGHAELQRLSAALEQRVTERTAQLGATQRTLQTLLDALPSMVGYWDAGLVNRFANAAYRNWFGEAGSNLPGKHMVALLGPALFEQNRPFVEGALRGEPQTFERAIPRPNGEGVRHSLAHYLPDVVEGEVRGFYVLVHDVTEITENRQRLAQGLKEREVMLQEIHHRVKNNLQVVSSLLSLQRRRLAQGDAYDALEDCQRRVTTIALIHEQLYHSRDFSRVGFREYVRALVSNVFRTAATSPSVRLELAIEDIALDVGLAIPCGLVVNELVTNALKHAFNQRLGGTVRVKFSRRGSFLELEVSDDGAGLPAGFNIRQTASLGLQVVTTLAEQLGGTLEVVATSGSKFRLTFSDGVSNDAA
jgi:PAS domain S-box-containing protein